MRHLVIMVKEPRPGRVKTRLGADIGMTSAAWWFRHQSARLLRRVGQDPRWRTWLAVSPDVAGMCSRVWPEHIERVPQGRGDLGVRMARIFEVVPPGPCLIVGADIPGIDATRIAEGFDALCRAEAVIGPAADGGYWMIGLRRGARPLPGRLFEAVRWSSKHALADTERTLAPLTVAHTTLLRDVDTVADLP